LEAAEECIEGERANRKKINTQLKERDDQIRGMIESDKKSLQSVKPTLLNYSESSIRN
jgi:hypothetical protein